jgi:hypothetical protein
MIRATLLALAVGCLATSASAMPPLSQANAIARPDIAVNVKIICEQDGHCYQRGRRPVARWVYGEGNFSGPYTGPGHYSWPAYRSRWWLLW